MANDIANLYIDPMTKKIGSRDSLNAIYTRDSIGEKQKPFWRDLQRLRKSSREKQGHSECGRILPVPS
jgi:hypothetical protein